MTGVALALLVGAAPAVADEPSIEALIADAQRMLRLGGYDPGTEDGKLGPRTQHAIRAYQRAVRQELGRRHDDLGHKLPALKPEIR